jgi:hypothetical protein
MSSNTAQQQQERRKIGNSDRQGENKTRQQQSIKNKRTHRKLTGWALNLLPYYPAVKSSDLRSTSKSFYQKKDNSHDTNPSD